MAFAGTLQATASAVLLGLVSATAVFADEPAKICGGLQGLACDAKEFCDFPGGTCGAGDQSGACMPRPDICTREYLLNRVPAPLWGG